MTLRAAARRRGVGRHKINALVRAFAGVVAERRRGERLGDAAWDCVKELAPPDADDARRPGLGPEPAPAPHQVVVEAERRHIADAGRVGCQQR